MCLSPAVFVFFASIFVIFCEKIRFDNYQIYSINIENEKQFEVMENLESNQDGIIFLQSPTTIGDVAELIVSPQKLANITELFERYEISNKLRVENVQRFA